MVDVVKAVHREGLPQVSAAWILVHFFSMPRQTAEVIVTGGYLSKK